MRPCSRVQRFLLILIPLLVIATQVVYARTNLTVQGPGEVTVNGNQIFRDGKPWVARGVVLVAFVATKDRLKPAYAKARAAYGDSMLDGIIGFGADVVRIHVSQPALDPRSPGYEPEYLADFTKAVNLARKRGLTVIVSMQWQPPTGWKNPSLPSDATKRAWKIVAPIWKNDKGVLYNLFNEPGLRENTPANWAIWQDLHQELVNLVRSTGAQNTLVVDGLRASHYLAGVPQLNDPMGQIIYGVHAFFNRHSLTAEAWERDWGSVADRLPVMVTAWNARSDEPSCKRNTPEIAKKFLAYLRKKSIGLIVWAFDLPNIIVRDFKTFTPLSYNNFDCRSGYRTGAGQLIKEHFLAR